MGEEYIENLTWMRVNYDFSLTRDCCWWVKSRVSAAHEWFYPPTTIPSERAIVIPDHTCKILFILCLFTHFAPNIGLLLTLARFVMLFTLVYSRTLIQWRSPARHHSHCFCCKAGTLRHIKWRVTMQCDNRIDMWPTVDYYFWISL